MDFLAHEFIPTLKYNDSLYKEEKVVTFYRRLPKFEYFKPKSLDEALDFLKGNNTGETRVYVP